MDNNSIEKLQNIIENRKRRVNYSGGAIFIIWGLLILSSMFIHKYLLHYEWIFFIVVVIGIIFQVLFLRYLRIKAGYKTLWRNTVNYMWFIILLIIIIVGLLFTSVIKLYSINAGNTLIFFYLAPGMYLSGLILDNWSLKTGGFIFIIFSILIAMDNSKNSITLQMLGMIFGQIIPGIFSILEDKYFPKKNI